MCVSIECCFVDELWCLVIEGVLLLFICRSMDEERVGAL